MAACTFRKYVTMCAGSGVIPCMWQRVVFGLHNNAASDDAVHHALLRQATAVIYHRMRQPAAATAATDHCTAMGRGLRTLA